MAEFLHFIGIVSDDSWISQTGTPYILIGLGRDSQARIREAEAMGRSAPTQAMMSDFSVRVVERNDGYQSSALTDFLEEARAADNPTLLPDEYLKELLLFTNEHDDTQAGHLQLYGLRLELGVYADHLLDGKTVMVDGDLNIELFQAVALLPKTSEPLLKTECLECGASIPLGDLVCEACGEEAFAKRTDSGRKDMFDYLDYAELRVLRTWLNDLDLRTNGGEPKAQALGVLLEGLQQHAVDECGFSEEHVYGKEGDGHDDFSGPGRVTPKPQTSAHFLHPEYVTTRVEQAEGRQDRSPAPDPWDTCQGCGAQMPTQGACGYCPTVPIRK